MKYRPLKFSTITFFPPNNLSFSGHRLKRDGGGVYKIEWGKSEAVTTKKWCKKAEMNQSMMCTHKDIKRCDLLLYWCRIFIEMSADTYLLIKYSIYRQIINRLDPKSISRFRRICIEKRKNIMWNNEMFLSKFEENAAKNGIIFKNINKNHKTNK